MDLCGKDKYEHVDKNTRGEKPTLALGDRSPADDHKAFGPGSTTLLFTAPAGDLELTASASRFLVVSSAYPP
jgi:hypothetical protein